MTQAGDGVHLADLEYLDRPEAIAAAILECDGGLAIVDPGPTTSLAGLRRGLDGLGASVDDVVWLLLTHIHLDHSGGAGVLVRENPRIRVHVHVRGAKHIVDPGRLLDSASRLYGSEMERLWGEVAPVPPTHVDVLHGGETLALGKRPVQVAYTPGHAWHHVSYLDEASGVAFVGDTCGERFRDAPYVLPVTPPPDIDLAAWSDSLALIRAWEAAALFVTHFGFCSRPDWHIDSLRAELADWAEQVRRSLEADGTDDERAEAFAHGVWKRLESIVPGETLHLYHGGAPDDGWRGLARYWRKAAERARAR